MNPAIILVRPQMGENIGAAARAMANFGVRDLRLVAPRDGWPNPKASDMAGKALNVVDDAQLFPTTAAAVADCQFIVATTARERAMNLPVFDARDAMQQLATRAARGERVAILFGPERTGLENDDVIQANAVVTIPVSADYASLNLAQAVVVLCYEWLMAQAAVGDINSFAHQREGLLAPRAEMDGLFGQLETALDDVNFWRVPEKKDGMWRNIRAVLIRAGMNPQEIAAWRGIVKALRG